MEPVLTQMEDIPEEGDDLAGLQTRGTQSCATLTPLKLLSSQMNRFF